MRTKTKGRLAAMILSALAVVGIGGAAIAQTGTTAVNQSQSQSTAPADETEGQSPSYTGSITAPDDNSTDGAETADDEAAEAEALAGLATVTPEKAKAAALAEVPGTVIKVELDNENGSVVYSVEIDTGSGQVDVKVDAGNANVLHQDADNDNEAGE